MKRAFPSGPLTRDLPSQVLKIWYDKDKEPDDCERAWMSSDYVCDAWEDTERAQLSSVIADVLQSLTKKETSVLYMRFFHDMTLDEIAKSMDLSKERIRQIEAKGLRKLKHPSRADRIRGVLFGEPISIRLPHEPHRRKMQVQEHAAIRHQLLKDQLAFEAAQRRAFYEAEELRKAHEAKLKAANGGYEQWWLDLMAKENAA